MTDNNMEAWVAWGDANLPARPPDMPGPNETRLNLIDGIEYIMLRADDFRAEIARLREDNRRLAECWDASVKVQEQTEAEIDRLKHLHDLDHSLADQREAEVERLRATLVQIENWTGKLPSNLGEAALVFEYVQQAATAALDRDKVG